EIFPHRSLAAAVPTDRLLRSELREVLVLCEIGQMHITRAGPGNFHSREDSVLRSVGPDEPELDAVLIVDAKLPEDLLSRLARPFESKDFPVLPCANESVDGV